MGAADPALRAALVVGAAALLLTLALIVRVATMRLLTRRREQRAQDVADRWRPLLLRQALGDTVALPALAPHQRLPLLLLWNHLADSLRGPSHDRLRDVLGELALLQPARHWLERGSAEQQLLALLTLGHLGRNQDWERVLQLLADPRPYLSLAAARALLQIDPARAAEPVVAAIVAHPDWPLARVAVLLRDADAARVFEQIQQRLQAAEPALQLRLIRLLVSVDPVRASTALEPLLEGDERHERLSLCLQHVQTPGTLPRVRALAQHPVWWVRLQAAGALGRLGMPQDRPQLLALLSDPQWWVRYRAAGALASLPGSSAEMLARLRDSLEDRYARDVLRQVMVERGMAAAA
jgi:HEAT repeat protein